jgi:glutamyl-tRNA synthetase
MTVITRFAPSPTGTLHVGNLRTALHNWMFAQKQSGRFLLRIDDTDQARSEERHVDSIRADLAWLGLTIDGEERQSARFDRYAARFAELVAAGRVYPAYETAQELDLKRKVLLGRGLPPIYDRAALALSDADRAALEGQGVRPHWRFRLLESPIVWDDEIRGPQRFDPATMGDPVIRRADGSWLYLFPSVVDDIDMGVTHVVRGEDHVSNTATQLQMFEALGSTPPAFAHEALLTGNEGKLSKRLGSLGVDHFRESGIEPQTLVALLARIGTSDPVEPLVDPAPLIASFDFARFGRAPARFDEAELAQLNARIVHQLGFRRRGRPASRRHDVAGVGDDPAQYRHRRRGGRLVARGRRPGRCRRSVGGSRLSGAGGRVCRHDRLVGRSLACAHQRAQGSDRPQGQAAVPAAATRAHRAPARPRHGGFAPADRQGSCAVASRSGGIGNLFTSRMLRCIITETGDRPVQRMESNACTPNIATHRPDRALSAWGAPSLINGALIAGLIFAAPNVISHGPEDGITIIPIRDPVEPPPVDDAKPKPDPSRRANAEADCARSRDQDRVAQ